MGSDKDFAGLAVLVTGGAGFIGSHLVDALLERGARVRVLDDLSNGKRENLAHCASRIEFLEGDIRDVGVCARACRDIAVVFHQAALGSVPRSMKDPSSSIAVNVGGTANVFAAARDAGVRRLVYASSSSVYGDSTRLPKREGEEGRPLSPYALSKVVDEELAEVFGRCYGLELVGLRYFNVYGPRQDPHGPYAAVVPLFFSACLKDEAPVIFGDGAQSRDFTFVADAVAANLRGAVAPSSACGKAYNVAGGNQTSVNDLAQAIRQAVGKGAPARHEPPRAGDVLHSAADLSRVGRELGYAPTVSLAEGLRRSLDHYRVAAGDVGP
ncbi:MAG TPA: SDR family oxidoreductase [Thermoanaerobaculia bacterium]|jgi:nucleoside-diphosphate-sugar epimerase